jgi:hypothetical protein
LKPESETKPHPQPLSFGEGSKDSSGFLKKKLVVKTGLASKKSYIIAVWVVLLLILTIKNQI